MQEENIQIEVNLFQSEGSDKVGGCKPEFMVNKLKLILSSTMSIVKSLRISLHYQ